MIGMKSSCFFDRIISPFWFVVSHPFARKKAKGWATQQWYDFKWSKI
jgi:hypothetical protein